MKIARAGTIVILALEAIVGLFIRNFFLTSMTPSSLNEYWATAASLAIMLAFLAVLIPAFCASVTASGRQELGKLDSKAASKYNFGNLWGLFEL